MIIKNPIIFSTVLDVDIITNPILSIVTELHYVYNQRST